MVFSSGRHVANCGHRSGGVLAGTLPRGGAAMVLVLTWHFAWRAEEAAIEDLVCAILM